MKEDTDLHKIYMDLEPLESHTDRRLGWHAKTLCTPCSLHYHHKTSLEGQQTFVSLPCTNTKLEAWSICQPGSASNLNDFSSALQTNKHLELTPQVVIDLCSPLFGSCFGFCAKNSKDAAAKTEVRSDCTDAILMFILASKTRLNLSFHVMSQLANLPAKFTK